MLDIQQTIEKPILKAKIPDFQVGDTVRVSIKLKEKEGEKEKTKTYSFQGIVIKRKGGGIRETFTVRKESHGVGIERVFPIHLPIIHEIRVLKKGKVRRAKLYYLRKKKK